MDKSVMQSSSQDVEKEFTKTFEKLKYCRNSYSIWSDFVTIFACSISNIVDKRYFDEREEMYLKIINKYNKDEQELFAKLMAKTFIALTDNPQQDFLGNIFMSLKLGNGANGQFFTPYHICEFMAKLTIDVENVKQTLKDTGSFSVCDPTCGSGALLIAAVNEINTVLKDEKSINLGKIVFAGQDIDYVVAMMCYIQLSILDVPGYIKVGNSLANPISANDLLDNNYWVTPAYIRNNFRIKQISRVESTKELETIG